MYCTEFDTTPVDVVVVTVGTRWPTRICAFSWLSVRMRGLASSLTSPSVLLALMVIGSTDTPIVEPRAWYRSLTVSGPPEVRDSGDSEAWPGHCTPRLSRSDRCTSRISTSSITSASGTSCSLTRRSAMRIASGVSRITTAFCFSSTTTSRIFSSVRSVCATVLASALSNASVRITSAW